MLKAALTSLWAWTKFSISDSKLTAASLAILADVLKACWARVRARLKAMALAVMSSTRAITAKSVVAPVAERPVPGPVATSFESSEELELSELLSSTVFSFRLRSRPVSVAAAAFLFFLSLSFTAPPPEAWFGRLGEGRRGEAGAEITAL